MTYGAFAIRTDSVLPDVWLAPAPGRPQVNGGDRDREGQMAGPFPICIKTEDGKRFNGEYFTIPDPHAGGSMGTVRVRDEGAR